MLRSCAPRGRFLVATVVGCALALAAPGASRAGSCDWHYDPAIGSPGLSSASGGSSARAFESLGGDVVVGGGFLTAGGVTSPMCARWDGAHWSAMGGGFSGTVYSLVTFQGSLYAFGQYQYAFPNEAWRAARWNGASWQPLGADQGLRRPSNFQYGEAFTSLVKGDSLIVGGRFTRAGDQSVGLIAAWDGAAWHALGAGFDSLSSDSGSCQWTNYPYVRAMTLYHGDLIAGGTFRVTADGDTVHGIARWDGTSWHGMGTGMGTIPSDCSPPWVFAMTVWNGDLIVGGYFRTVNGQRIARVARWDGASWHAMGGAWDNNYGGYVDAFAVSQSGELLAGGLLQQQGPPIDKWQLARWNGVDWEQVGPDLTWITATSVAALSAQGPDVYVGGGFTGDADGDTMNFVTTLRCGTITAVEPGRRASRIALRVANANPFAGSTVLTFDLPSDVEDARLEIYDPAGRRVRTLHTGPATAGTQQATWRGRDDSGSRLPPGVYFARLQVGQEVSAVRLVRL